MKIERDADLGVLTVWLTQEEHDKKTAAEVIRKIKGQSSPREKVVVFISGTRPVTDYTSALLKSQLSQAASRGA